MVYKLMTMLHCIAFFLSFFAFVYSAPAAQDLPRIKLEEDYSENTIIYKGQNDIHGNYRRAKRSTVIKIPLKNYKNYQYHAKVKFGSNNQEYKIMFDTGSGFTWIPKKHSEENTCAKKYKHFESNTFEDFHTVMTTVYVKGEATMKLGSDSVTIGNMVVNNQTLGLAIKSDCEGNEYEGIIGLSFLSINHSSIIQNMLSQGLIKEPVFAFYLNRNHGSTDSELTIGGYNTDHIKNDQLNPIQVTDPEHWQVPIEMVRFGKQVIAVYQKAIIDSGSSLIVAPFKFLQCFIDIIRKSYNIDLKRQENGLLSFKRNQSLKLPNITFVLGNNLYTLTEKDYTIENDQDIEISISFIDYSSDTWILGDLFLQKYYLVFDYGRRTISFPKTRFIDGDLLKSIIDRHLPSKGNSMNIVRIQENIYLLICLFIIFKLNFILTS
ncbi:unnamed protein product [Nezara viridula]|uniref:Peptidase A1 domain-containing protein n=1 Tax=Nezara viridula TaxID=85310 RepID=A0A9P0HD75_NEZVI|nr:unnamed protein product [Nezara viridula]